MRVLYGFTLAAAVAVLVPNLNAQMQDVGKAVPGGGIKVAGWQAHGRRGRGQGRTHGRQREVRRRRQRLPRDTGPAITYWNPANKAAGNYTVKATFVEKEFMNLNDHAHPYGIVIGGNDLGTPTCQPALLLGLRQRHVHRPRLRTRRRSR